MPSVVGWFQLQNRQSIAARSVLSQSIHWLSWAVFHQRPWLLSPAITPACGAFNREGSQTPAILREHSKKWFHDIAILPPVSESDTTWAFTCAEIGCWSIFLLIHRSSGKKGIRAVISAHFTALLSYLQGIIRHIFKLFLFIEQKDISLNTEYWKFAYQKADI